MTRQGIQSWRQVILTIGLGLAILLSAFVVDAGSATAQSTGGRDVPGFSPEGGEVPGGALGSDATSDMWRAIRQGDAGSVVQRDGQSAVMIQSEGDNWRALRNGPLKLYSTWIMLGMLGLLALFFLLRGRVRIEAGPAGRTIERFSGLDRFAHWLTATTFVVLALTGLNLMFGRYFLLPLVGPEFFGTLTLAGKYAHNYLAFPFMLGLVLMFVLWVKHNIPNRHDFVWVAKAGGLFSKHSHPPARKFNAGQKVLFWLVIIGGLSLSLSGVALMFPFETDLWGKTLGFLAALGLDVPTNISPMMEMQLNSIWHAAVAVVMIAIILGHIYIGTLGMEGAFAAMGSGKVDLNWAREHHNLWVEEEERKGQVRSQQRRKAAAPAE
ncbi:formate dehydrogenase subunit gamma [Aquibaculum sediminis]|uniref:formate dehydrogenase subunit gamma n=1 Tax=Aquibaculum sediminis TaxID=3231907 RepID=UPI0034535A40